MPNDVMTVFKKVKRGEQWCLYTKDLQFHVITRNGDDADVGDLVEYKLFKWNSGLFVKVVKKAQST